MTNIADIRINKIVRSKRRTLALEISQDAGLIVRAPAKASLDYIEKIIQQKRDWILKKQGLALSRAKRFSPKKFVDGEDFLYLGDTYKLSIGEDCCLPFAFDGGFRLSRPYIASGRELFTKWYTLKAHTMIQKRLKLYSHVTGLKYTKFSISGAKKRWGCCSVNGSLHFTWRLIMAPLKVIDYVVVHELTHIAVKNHSRAFWTKVSTIMPDYKHAKDWLRHNGFLLSL